MIDNIDCQEARASGSAILRNFSVASVLLFLFSDETKDCVLHLCGLLLLPSSPLGENKAAAALTHAIIAFLYIAFVALGRYIVYNKVGNFKIKHAVWS